MVSRPRFVGLPEELSNVLVTAMAMPAFLAYSEIMSSSKQPAKITRHKLMWTEVHVGHCPDMGLDCKTIEIHNNA